jgi:hypothetical protein
VNRKYNTSRKKPTSSAFVAAPTPQKRDATREVAMGNSGNRFDQCLFDLKLQPLSRKMQAESMVSDRAAIRLSRETGGSLLVKTVDGQLMVLRTWLEGVDQICREVWQAQGETITPDFVRGTLVPKASELIAARVGTIKSNLEMKVRRGVVQPGNPDVYRANHHLAMEIRKLQAEVNNGYEIEARELEHKKLAAEKIGLTQGLPSNVGGRFKNATATPFAHSADYRTVTIRGETHRVTAQQAQMVEILHEAYKNGTPDVSIAHILERLEKNSSRWQDTFKSNPEAKKALIKSGGVPRGTLRLNL